MLNIWKSNVNVFIDYIKTLVVNGLLIFKCNVCSVRKIKFIETCCDYEPLFFEIVSKFSFQNSLKIICPHFYISIFLEEKLLSVFSLKITYKLLRQYLLRVFERQTLQFGNKATIRRVERNRDEAWYGIGNTNCSITRLIEWKLLDPPYQRYSRTANRASQVMRIAVGIRCIIWIWNKHLCICDISIGNLIRLSLTTC